MPVLVGSTVVVDSSAVVAGPVVGVTVGSGSPVAVLPALVSSVAVVPVSSPQPTVNSRPRAVDGMIERYFMG